MIKRQDNLKEMLSMANAKSLAKSEIVKKYGIFQIGNVIAAISGLILYITMARFITASDIGVYSLYFYTLSLLFSVFSFSLHNVLTILTPFYLTENRRLSPRLITGNYIFAITISILAVILLFCFRGVFYNLLNIESSKLPIVFFAIFPFFILFYLNDHLFLGLKQIKYRTILFTFNAALNVLLIVVFLVAGYGLSGAFAGFCLAILLCSVLGFITHWVKNAKELGISRKEVYFFPMKKAMTLGIAIIPMSICHFLIGTSDRFFIANFLGTAEVGIYAVSVQLTALLHLMIHPLFSIAVPYISEKWAEKDIQGVQRIKTKLTYVVLSSAIICIFITIFGKSILSIVFTETYVKGYFALVILSWGTFFYLLYLVVGNTLSCVDEAPMAAKIVIVSAPINIVLNYFLVRQIGMEGVAIATSITYMTMMLLSVLAWKKWLRKVKVHKKGKE